MQQDLTEPTSIAPPPPTERSSGALTTRIELFALTSDGFSSVEGEFQAVRVRSRGFWFRLLSFVGLFLLPVAGAVVYFGFIATDIYISETKFVVRSVAHSDGSGIAMLAQSQGLGRAVDETYAVTEYMQSRDVATLLERENGLRDVMGRKELDFIARFPNVMTRNNQEQFYKAYRRMIDMSVDNTTGISTLEVYASRPGDAHAISAALIEKGERFINQLNDRSQKDSVEFAENLIKESSDRLADVERRLADYRNKEMLLDPEKQASQSLLLLGQMSTEISHLETTLASQLSITPDSPVIAPLRERIRAFRTEYEKQQQSLAGGSDSIARKLQKFEMLTLERELDGKEVTAAALELEKARHDALSQRVYLQTIVGPDTPDQPLRPRRLLWISIVAIACFSIYRILRSLIESTMDHV